MKIQNIATLILCCLGVTACSGGSGGSNSSSSSNDHSSDSVQFKQIQSALDEKKKSLERAQQAVQKAEQSLQTEIAKTTQESKARQQAETALAEKQAELAKAQQAVQKAEQNLQTEIAKTTQEATARQQAETALSEKQAELTKVQQALESAVTKLTVIETAEKEQLAEAQKIAEKNAKRRKNSDDSFKSKMGNDSTNPYPKDQFSTERLTVLNVDGQWIPAVSRDIPFDGFSDQATSESRLVLGENRVYNQQYSSVFGSRIDLGVYSNNETLGTRFMIEKVSGQLTDVDNIPKLGTANYNGLSFGAYGVGNFNYTINFDEKSGSGKISNLVDVKSLADVILEKGTLNGNLIESTLKTDNHRFIDEHYEKLGGFTGSYILGVYGPNAEEVAGKAVIDNSSTNMTPSYTKTDQNGPRTEIGFAGKQ
ncbi:hypothetical protein A1D22_00815 [Pasteurellaceae bacterium LFhippo2]|nr:hypothetical protein [Pasteurellaceae bacterium LFhippo2]